MNSEFDLQHVYPLSILSSKTEQIQNVLLALISLSSFSGKWTSSANRDYALHCLLTIIWSIKFRNKKKNATPEVGNYINIEGVEYFFAFYVVLY